MPACVPSAWPVVHERGFEPSVPPKAVYVEATEGRGRSRWKGEGQGLGFRLCQAIKGVLTGDDLRSWWSQRASDRLGEVRGDYSWLTPGSTVILRGPDGVVAWWTFAGYRANASLAPALAEATHSQVLPNSFSLTFEGNPQLGEIEQAIATLRSWDSDRFRPAVDERAVEGLKFSECLPSELALSTLQARLHDRRGVEHVQRLGTRIVIRSGV